MNKDKLRWVLEVKEDPISGELFLEFPPDFLETVNWKEGDNLIWKDNGDSSWSLNKSDK